MTYNLRVICEEIIKCCPRVKSIYLTGGFARGEGSVLVEGEKFTILGDYDLVVIVDGWKTRIILNKDNINKRLKNVYVLPGHPIYEIIVWRKGEIKSLPPTKFLYDFKVAKRLYGKLYDMVIPSISDADIPLSEGLRLIFNRLQGLLIPFSPELFYVIPKTRQLRHLTFESAKQILGCIEALLILDRVQFPTQKENVEFAIKHFPKRFSGLIKKFPQFHRLAKLALKYKLNPQKKIEGRALDLWIKARDLTMITLEVFLEEVYRKTPNNPIEIAEELINKIPHPHALNLLSTIHNLRHRSLRLRCLYKKPLNALIGVSVLLVCSVERHGYLNVDYLKAANDILADHFGHRVYENSLSKLWLDFKEYIRINYFDPFSPRARSILKWF